MQENFLNFSQEKLNSIKKKGEKIAVFGGGITGNAVIQFLKKRNFNFCLIDSKKPEEDIPYLNDNLAKNDIMNFSCFIKSPGINPSHPILKMVEENNILVLSEIDLAYIYFKGKILAISGTDGKSTCTALTFHLLKNIFPNSEMGGNIGIPFIEFCEKNLDYAVLELSSYQLEDSFLFKSFSSTILNIANDHLERHKTFENYIKAKMKIIDHENPNFTIILNNRQVDLFPIDKNNFKGNLLQFGFNSDCDAFIDTNLKIIITKNYKYNISEYKLNGNHNLENLAASLLLLETISDDYKNIETSISGFNGLKHRFQNILNWKSIQFINDSKSTNIHSLLSGLKGFTPKQRIILILGGIPKKEPIDPLIENLVSLDVKVLMFGEMVNSWYDIFINSNIKINQFKNLDEVIQALVNEVDLLNPEFIIFSPGGASFDLYKNFEERGDHFIKLVNKYFINE